MNLLYIVLSLFGLEYVYRYPEIAQINRDEPLIVTDYLNNGQADLARHLSRLEPLVGNVQSYAGFFRVSNDCVKNMYFWYFPAESGNTSAPLLVWLQGGPGASSLYGLFTENGPYYIDWNDEVQLRELSWTKEYSVIFIDNPVGTGFSYFPGEECYLTTEDQVGLYLALCMQQFYQLFPSLRPNPLYITGESYAGKYVPAMVYAIHKMNLENPTPINLVGMAIGDGLCDPYNMLNYGTYLNKIGLIFDNQIVHFDRYFELIRQSIEAGEFYQASIYKDNIFEFLTNLTGLTNHYNYYLDRGVPYDNYIRFLNANSRKVNAGNLSFYDDSDPPFWALYPDRTMSIAPIIREIINAGYKTLFYSGQFDIMDPFPSTSAFLRALDWDGKDEFVVAPQHIWYSNSGKVYGYYRSAGNLMQLLVRNSGHMVPTDQPEATLDMLKLFIYEF